MTSELFASSGMIDTPELRSSGGVPPPIAERVASVEVAVEAPASGWTGSPFLVASGGLRRERRLRRRRHRRGCEWRGDSVGARRRRQRGAHGWRNGGQATGLAREIDPLQQQRELGRWPVLHVVDVHLLLGRAARHVDALDPGRRLAQVLRPRRDHQDRLQAAVRDEADDALGRAVLVVGENGVELLRDRVGVGRLERQDAERHAAHPVDVEDADQLGHRGKLAAGAGEHQQVAGRIDTQDAGLRRRRLQDALHLGGRDIAQGHELGGEADELPRACPRRPQRRSPGGRLIGRHDLVDAAGSHQRRPLAAQDRVENVDQPGFVDRPGGAQGDAGLDLVADDVVDAQRLAENDLGRLGDRGTVEVERDAVRAARGRLLRRTVLGSCEVGGSGAARLPRFGRGGKIARSLVEAVGPGAARYRRAHWRAGLAAG